MSREPPLARPVGNDLQKYRLKMCPAGRNTSGVFAQEGVHSRETQAIRNSFYGLPSCALYIIPRNFFECTLSRSSLSRCERTRRSDAQRDTFAREQHGAKYNIRRSASERVLYSLFTVTFDVKRFISRRLRQTKASCSTCTRNVSFRRRSYDRRRTRNLGLHFRSFFLPRVPLAFLPPSLPLFLHLLQGLLRPAAASPLVARIIEFPVISRRNTLYLLWRGMRVVLFGARMCERNKKYMSGGRNESTVLPFSRRRSRAVQRDRRVGVCGDNACGVADKTLELGYKHSRTRGLLRPEDYYV